MSRVATSRVVVGASVGIVLVAASAVADPLGAVEPSKQEQHGIYVINRARHDPQAYAKQIGVPLPAATPQPPLAVNMNLTGSARFHSKEMVDNRYFAHVSQVTGDGPNAMIVQNGYDLFGNGLNMNWGTANNTESIAFGENLIPKTSQAVELLVIDKGVPDLGHRKHILATIPFYRTHREIGVGRAQGTSAAGRPIRYYSIHTGYVSTGDKFLTGVVYADANKNGKYDVGEGVGGATITAGGAQTTSMSAGGYSIPVAAGIFDMTCSGGGFLGEGTAKVTVTDANIEVDFRSGVRGAQIDFIDFVPPPFPGPDVRATAANGQGTAPHDAGLMATSDDGAAAYSWEFGDGRSSNGANPNHAYATSGLFTAICSATNGDGTNKALTVVAVGATNGIVVPPSTHDLTVTKFKAKVNFKKVGKDKVTAVFTMEVPGGFTPGERTISVNIGGVSVDIPISAKGKGKDLAGNKFVMKSKELSKAAKAGGSVGNGVVAKVKVLLKGDMAEMLGIAGLRNTNETRTIPEFPIAVLLDAHAYRAAPAVLEKSKEGKKSAGTLAP